MMVARKPKRFARAGFADGAASANAVAVIDGDCRHRRRWGTGVGCAGGRLRLLVGEFERVTEVLGNLRRAFTAYKGGNAVVQLASVTAASLITRSYSSTPIPDGLHSLPTPHPCLYPYVSVQARRT